jgi:hypothetical protein
VKLIKFLAYPVVVVVLWVAFAAATLSGLATVRASLHSIAEAEQPLSRPSDATEPGQNRRVAHVGRIDQAPSHPG